MLEKINKLLRIHVSDYACVENEQAFGIDILDTDNFLLEEISKELTENKPLCEEIVLSYIKTFLYLLYRKIDTNFTTKNIKWSNKIIAEAEEYINNNYRYLNT